MYGGEFMSKKYFLSLLTLLFISNFLGGCGKPKDDKVSQFSDGLAAMQALMSPDQQGLFNLARQTVGACPNVGLNAEEKNIHLIASQIQGSNIYFTNGGVASSVSNGINSTNNILGADNRGNFVMVYFAHGGIHINLRICPPPPVALGNFGMSGYQLHPAFRNINPSMVKGAILSGFMPTTQSFVGGNGGFCSYSNLNAGYALLSFLDGNGRPLVEFNTNFDSSIFMLPFTSYNASLLLGPVHIPANGVCFR